MSVACWSSTIAPRGGGGGGGGDESLEMPSLVEVAGEDDLNVPVELPEPEEVEAPPELISEPEAQLLESRSVRLSAVPMAAAQQTRSGVFEGLMARTLNSAGSGSEEDAAAAVDAACCESAIPPRPRLLD